MLHRILERVSSEDELKYAHLGLKLFKTQGIKINTKGASLFIKVGSATGPDRLSTTPTAFCQYEQKKNEVMSSYYRPAWDCKKEMCRN